MDSALVVFLKWYALYKSMIYLVTYLHVTKKWYEKSNNGTNGPVIAQKVWGTKRPGTKGRDASIV